MCLTFDSYILLEMMSNSDPLRYKNTKYMTEVYFQELRFIAHFGR